PIEVLRGKKSDGTSRGKGLVPWKWTPTRREVLAWGNLTKEKADGCTAALIGNRSWSTDQVIMH
ncbi:unnamed protein product, partial [Discosporangium mesarthrocarpum]